LFSSEIEGVGKSKTALAFAAKRWLNDLLKHGNQLSWVRPDGKMSVYTYHLLKALLGAANQPGDKVVRVSHLKDYLSKTVPKSARDSWKAEQTPFFDFATEDFAIALLNGGKGLATEGWNEQQAEEKIREILNQDSVNQKSKKLHAALISAFPERSSLEQLLYFELDKNLNTITPDSNLNTIVFKLIQTAESQGWLSDLVLSAYKSNPGNLELKAIAKELRLI
jgi:Effector-associated domain 1